MAFALLGWDGSDGEARRKAVRDRHLALLREWAADGRLALGVPLFDAAWRVAGSLMLLDVPDRAGVEAYLTAEPFATDGVWARHELHPFRIAPLPYRPLVAPDAPIPFRRTHTVVIAWDGRDEDAAARRLAVRAAHMARVGPMARDGTLALGGALLDAAGERMVGSIALTAHASDAAARGWMADDPYVTGDVWRDVTLWGTRLAPLPYRPLPDRPLPGGAAARPDPAVTPVDQDQR